MIWRGVVAALFLATAGSVGTAVFAQTDTTTSHVITVHDQDETYSFMTNKRILGDALREARVPIDPQDSVEPSLTEELIASSYQVNIYRVRPVTVVDGATRIKVLSARRTAPQIAKDAHVTLYDEDLTALEQTDVARDGAGLILTITRATPVTLDFYGTKTTIRTQATTVREFLDEKQLTLGVSDRISHTDTARIVKHMEIRIWREGVQTITAKEAIPSPKRLVYDLNRPLGYRAVQTEGKQGVRTIVYEIEIREGKEVSRKQLSSIVSQTPKETVEVVGLKNDGSGLSLSKGAHYVTDSRGVSHRETYYDLPMGVVMQACGQGGRYSVRPDGAKVDADGYIIVAANYAIYPRCSVVETSLGPGKVYDTGGFAARHPHGFDLATDWSKPDGI